MMSEKRLASSGDSFVDLTEMQIVDLLNKLSDENTRLHKKVDEQQATIRKLQDLCGESDGENAKLRIENKKLKEENEQLREYIDTIFESNTHICNELDIEDVQFYCERNKDYRSPSCLYQKCFTEENLIGLSEKIRELFDDE